jgi:chemotaxis protein histidine kinase CheA
MQSTMASKTLKTDWRQAAAGKSAEGTLVLSAEHRLGRILIRIADDGRGINRARVFAKAVEKGIVAADAQMAKEDIDALIFAPGFSTATTVTSVSGRGVGMDVVRQNVKELGGRITIKSEEGKGTSFTLTLPLTLAISDGMIVNVACAPSPAKSRAWAPVARCSMCADVSFLFCQFARLSEPPAASSMPEQAN